MSPWFSRKKSPSSSRTPTPDYYDDYYYDQLGKAAQPETPPRRRSKSSSAKKTSHDSGFDDDANQLSGIDPNYIAIKVIVFKNGQDKDQGTEITVSRRQYKHWVLFLDAITKKVASSTPVNHLWTLRGEEIFHFKQLEDDQPYVAGTKKFIKGDYGKITRTPKWTNNRKLSGKKFGALDSHESMEIFLQNMGYVRKHPHRRYPEDLKHMEGSEFDLRQVKLPRGKGRSNTNIQSNFSGSGVLPEVSSTTLKSKGHHRSRSESKRRSRGHERSYSDVSRSYTYD